MNIIIQLIEEHKKIKQSPSDDDLIRLSEVDEIGLKPICTLNVPVIMDVNNISIEGERLLNLKEFNAEILLKYPSLKCINWNNLLLAGGSCCEIINDNYHSTEKKDLDFFIYGLTEEEGYKKINEFIGQIIDYHRVNHTSTYKFYYKIFRNNNVMTIVIEGSISYQLIFRIYDTKADILYSFDLDSSAIGYDGVAVYMTKRGKFACDYRCNILDVNLQSYTYEYRLNKYFKRGYSIIMPYLDIYSVLKKKRFSNKYIVFKPVKIVRNIIKIRDITVKSNVGKSCYEPNNFTIDYLKYNDYHIRNLNMLNMLLDIDFYYGVIFNKVNILDYGPLIEVKDIEKKYNGIWMSLMNDNVNSKNIKKYIKIIETDVFLKNIFSLVEEDRKKYIDEVINKQITVLYKKLEEIKKKDYSKIDWKIGEDLKFPRYKVSNEEWYGLHLKK